MEEIKMKRIQSILAGKTFKNTQENMTEKFAAQMKARMLFEQEKLARDKVNYNLEIYQCALNCRI